MTNNLSARSTKRALRWLTPVAVLALAACQSAPATVAPSLAVGALSANAKAVSAPLLETRGRSEGYFTMSLPEEAELPKQIVSVTSGKAGSFSTTLMSAAAPMITNVIPNGDGFILEGSKLDKSTLLYYIGANQMTVVKKLPQQIVLKIPKAFKGTSGIITVRDGSAQIFRGSADAKNVYVTGRVVVRFPEGMPRIKIETALKTAGITYYRYSGMNYLVAYHAADVTFEQVKTKLLATSVFDQVSRDTIFEGKALAEPTDPRYPEQWALPKIGAPGGWPYSAGHVDTVVAVLDTGVNLNHPDLQGAIFKNLAEVAGNGQDDDGNGRIDDVYGWNAYNQTGNTEDDNGHGTEVAGIIAARQNTIGTVGLAYDSRILPVKISNAEGVATSSTLIDGINYAVRNRASVINLSLASNIDDPAVKEAIGFAETFNVSVVAAMGNAGNYIKQYPAAWSKDFKLMAVGATNSVDARPTWSTYGEWMTVCAPGESILTTAKGGGYTVVSGTSYAAAHVSAVAAMIKALKPAWTPAMVRDLIIATALDRGAPGFDNYYGNGRITVDVSALGTLLQQTLGDLEIEASSEHANGQAPAEKALDKDSETYWSSARREADDNQWLKIDLGKPSKITSIAALSAPFYSYLFPADFTIEVSDDDVNWRVVARETDFKIDLSTWARWDIPATTTKYVRFNVSRSRQNTDNGLYYAQIAEVAFNGEENAVVRTSSSNYYGFYYPTRNITDKNPDTFWVSANRKQATHEFAIADLGLSQSFSTIRLLSPPRIMSDLFPKRVAFYTSNDKVNWTFVKEFDNVSSQPATWNDFAVPSSTGRYLRLDFPESTRGTSHGSIYSGFQYNGFGAAVAEVEVR